jgi:hypothetical protein
MNRIYAGARKTKNGDSAGLPNNLAKSSRRHGYARRSIKFTRPSTLCPIESKSKNPSTADNGSIRLTAKNGHLDVVQRLLESTAEHGAIRVTA